LDAALDNRYIRWAGGLVLLLGAAQTALDVLGDDPIAASTFLLVLVGVILLALPVLERVRKERRQRVTTSQRRPEKVRRPNLRPLPLRPST
jgi:ABC-type Fe3+ transport system permease subunit